MVEASLTKSFLKERIVTKGKRDVDDSGNGLIKCVFFMDGENMDMFLESREGGNRQGEVENKKACGNDSSSSLLEKLRWSGIRAHVDGSILSKRRATLLFETVMKEKTMVEDISDKDEYGLVMFFSSDQWHMNRKRK